MSHWSRVFALLALVLAASASAQTTKRLKGRATVTKARAAKTAAATNAAKSTVAAGAPTVQGSNLLNSYPPRALFPVANTTEGLIAGIRGPPAPATDNDYYPCFRQFSNVRYGKAARFENPTMPDPYPTPYPFPIWAPPNVYQGTLYPPEICAFPTGDGGYTGSEAACFELIVYTPCYPPDPARYPNGYPVDVFWVGGEYAESPNYSNPANVFAIKETVVFVASYRNYILGGLVSNIGNVKGNFATLDQRQALKWVQLNAANFNGNPNHVVIHGQSAGAVSVSMHLTSPGSWGLFHGAVMESMGWAGPYDTLVNAGQYGDAIFANASCATLACMQGLPLSQIFALAATAYSDPNWPGSLACDPDWSPWSPTVIGSGDVVPQRPDVAFAAGNVADVPLLIGSNLLEANEFTFDPDGSYPDPMNRQDFEAAIAKYFGPQYVSALSALYPFPSPEYPNKTDYRYAFANMAGDYQTYCPMVKAVRGAQAQSKLLRTYMYQFNYPPTTNLGPSTTYGCTYGPCHSDELPFVFADQVTAMYKNDSRIAREINSAWTNFLHTYNPNAGAWADQVPIVYPLYDKTDKLTVIDSKSYIANNYRGLRCDFFDTYTVPTSVYLNWCGDLTTLSEAALGTYTPPPPKNVTKVLAQAKRVVDDAVADAGSAINKTLTHIQSTKNIAAGLAREAGVGVAVGTQDKFAKVGATFKSANNTV